MDITLERILSLIPKKEDGKFVHGAKKEFCDKIGAPSNIINEWERGTNKSYRNYLYQISFVYGVSVAWLKGESDEKNDTAKSGAVFGTYDAKLHCITHSAPISMLAHAYGMSSVLLSSAIGVGKARAQELITPFYSATDEEYKKAAEFFEIPLQEMKSGRIELVFNPLVLEKTRQLLLSEHQGD